MHRLEEEDPSIRYSRDPQTKELLLRTRSAAHRSHGRQAETAVQRRRLLKPPRIPVSRRRSRGRTEAHGRPQEADRRPRPVRRLQDQGRAAARGSDFEFVDDIFGGSIPRQFVPAVEKGIQRRAHDAVTSPVSRWSISASRCYDGSYHDVDSNELSFKMAGRLAFKDAMTRARPTILEPVMTSTSTRRRISPGT
jgi:elongation factor G